MNHQTPYDLAISRRQAETRFTRDMDPMVTTK